MLTGLVGQLNQENRIVERGVSRAGRSIKPREQDSKERS